MENGDVMRVAEVKNGKIDKTVSDKFVSLFVTAENGVNLRKAGDVIVARGELEALPLVGEEEIKVSVSPTLTEKGAKTVKEESNTATDSGKTQSGVVKILGSIGKIVGIGFLVLLIGVVVMTIITRRKETE
jgi:hypothetical protein